MLLKEILNQILTLVNIALPVGETPQKDFVAEAIKSNGFAVKQHKFWTEDDYHLMMHRIPKSYSSKNSVLLLHGLLSCGGQWVANGNKSLAFMLSEAGYDVWILNHRGTSLSKKHRYHTYNSSQYWNFSFHELGYYDVVAAIDYILNKQKKEKLHVIAHSQGVAAFLAGIILRPEYNRKIISSYIFNAAVFLHHLYEIPSAIAHNIVQLEHERKMNVAPVRNSLFIHLLQQFCQQPLVGVICTGFLLELFGGNSRQVEIPQTLLSIYFNLILDNASVKQMSHLVQIIDAQMYQMYDYGSTTNQKYYNMSKPPKYDLSKILFPVSVMYGTIDGLTTATDTKILIRYLKNIQDVIVLPWNHLDLIHSKHADKWLNDRIINSMNKYTNS